MGREETNNKLVTYVLLVGLTLLTKILSCELGFREWRTRDCSSRVLWLMATLFPNLDLLLRLLLMMMIVPLLLFNIHDNLMGR